MKLDTRQCHARHAPASEGGPEAITLTINASRLSEDEKLKAIKDSKMTALLSAAG
jgi:hypothetical protein